MRFYRRATSPVGYVRWRSPIAGPRSSPNRAGDSQGVADAAVAAWEEIDALLAPVLGRRGVAALYKRSIHLTLAGRPWLAPVCQGPVEPGALAALHAALAAQDHAVAASASTELLANFRALLAGLIGEALTRKLLAAQQPNPPGGHTTKDPLP